MSREEEFKKALQDIVDSKQIAFDEASWEGARQLIDDSKRKKRIALYFVLPILILLVPTGLYFYFATSDTRVAKVEKPVQTTAAENTVIERSPAVPAVEEAPATTPEIVPAKAAKLATPAVPVNEPSPAEPVKAGSDKSLVKVAKPEQSASESTNANTTKTVKAATITKEVQNANADSPIISTEPVVKANASADKPIVKNESEALANTAQESAGTNKDPETKQADKTASAESTKNMDNANNASTKSAEAVAQSGSVKDPVNNKTETLVAEPATQSVAVPEVKAADNATVTAEVPAVAAATAAAKPDTASSILLPDQNAAKNMLIAELGAAYNFGWKNPVKTDAKGFNPVVAILFSNALTNKLSASFGLQYSTVSNLNYSSHTSKVTQYKLAEESDVTVITPQRLHYLSVPLKAGYLIDRDNMIGVGYTMGYLMNVSSKIETYHEGIRNMQNYAVSRANGYTEGFRTIDSQISVFYRRRINGNFWANAEFDYGLSDAKSNSFFGTNIFERNTAVRISLMYNFYRK